MTDWKARAEKAEARVKELEADLWVHREPIPGLEKTWRSRAEKAEARVKEFEVRERDLDSEVTRYHESEPHWLARAEKAEADLAAARERIWELVAHHEGSHGGNCGFTLPDAILLKRAAGRESGTARRSPDAGQADVGTSTPSAAKPAALRHIPHRDPDGDLCYCDEDDHVVINGMEHFQKRAAGRESGGVSPKARGEYPGGENGSVPAASVGSSIPSAAAKPTARPSQKELDAAYARWFSDRDPDDDANDELERENEAYGPAMRPGSTVPTNDNRDPDDEREGAEEKKA